MKNQYDKLQVRLAHIIMKLNNSDTFTLKDLMDEFGISERTARRDMERLSLLPIEKENGSYFIDPCVLGNLSFKDIQKFATLCGIKSMFPSLENSFIAELLNEKINQAYLIKHQGFQNSQNDKKKFEELSAMIVANKQIKCKYNDKDRVLNPYKLINNNGIWYLLADDNGKLKNFTLEKISNLKITDNSFEPNCEFVEKIKANNTNWFSNESIEVTLEIKPEAAKYFLRKEILPNKNIISQTQNSLIISTNVSYDDEILRVVKYWIPFIKIVSPVYLHEKLVKILKDYIS
ncbi:MULTISPECIES: WYL domain-containing protein [unclassified Campylobacter]|uniref:helix-turn-helix transcriptional regulator n=1 Tax=unclassified Campylobacter TaxID=2593542 RepID=UPI0020160754|nr:MULTISPECIES: WYL domain-containing protein [unclassified Campylobacter]